MSIKIKQNKQNSRKIHIWVNSWVLALSTIWKSLEGDGKKPRSVNSEAFIAWLSSNICKPWDGIFEVRVCCLLPQRLTGKTARWKRAQTPQVSRADKHTWANSESCTQPSTRQRHHLRKGKGRLFSLLVSCCFFLFLILGLWSFLVFVTAGIPMT